jgi:DNA-binding XRE family transcriptional regulator
MTECGWSDNQLAEKTGIDKKSIVSHRLGRRKPNPKTLKEYAQAFSRELNRSITANQLKE